MSAYEWWKEQISDETAQELAKNYSNYTYGPNSSVYIELWDRLLDLFDNQTLSDMLQELATPGIKGNQMRLNLISGITSGTRAMSFAFGWPVPTSEDIVDQQFAYAGTDNPPVVFTMQGGIIQVTGNLGANYPAYPCGILTVPLEKLVCSVAPLFGFSVDNQEFFYTREWYNLREACVQYLWDGTKVAPVVISDAYKAYAEYDLIDKIGEKFLGWKSSSRAVIPIPLNSYLSNYYGSDLRATLGDDFVWIQEGVTYRTWFSTDSVRCAFEIRYYSYPSTGQTLRYSGFSSTSKDPFIMYTNSAIGSIPAKDSSTASIVYVSDIHTGPYGDYYWTDSLSRSDSALTDPVVIEPTDSLTDVISNSSEYLIPISEINVLRRNLYSLIANGDNVPDGLSQWTGNNPSPTWDDDCVYVYKNPNDTVKFVKVYVDPLERNITWNPDTQPDPQADTPPANTSPYVPSSGTPMPSPVPDPSPTIDVPSPTDPSYDPSDPLDDDDVVKLVDYDDTIVTPEVTPPTAPTETYPLPSGYTGTSGTSGMIHVYRPSPTAFNDFAAWLWVKWSDPVNVPRFWNNPIDGIISAHELYWGGHASGSEFIRSGFLESTVSAPVVDARYDTLDCGTINVPEYYGTYMDYSPYVKVSVYLPFVGIVELNPDDIIGAQVQIIYNTDAYTGACLAQILCTKGGVTQKLYEYNGNCAVTIPLSGGTQAQIVTGLLNAGSQVINGVGQLVTTALTGGAPNIGGLASDVLGAASTVLSAKSSVQHSGTFSSNYGAMGSKKPYLIIRRPIVVNATNFNLEYGYPAHKRVTIGACTGYLRVREVNVVSATATDEEKQEIESLLKAGVYVS